MYPTLGQRAHGQASVRAQDGDGRGRTATEHSARTGRPVVIVDLALDPAQTNRIAVAVSDGCSASSRTLSMGLLQGTGAGISVDTAMRPGVGYPLGPLECGDRIGPAQVLALLDALARAYGDGRYRACPTQRRAARAGGPLVNSEYPTAAMTSGTVQMVDAATMIAKQCAEAMWAQDRASRYLGMRITEIGPGHAQLAMSVTEQMVNGHGDCHGGYLAVLADSAFAFACNSYNEVTVAAGFDITFVAPGRLGDGLVADARERARFGRSGLYDVRVTASERLVAEFRGRSRSLGRPILPDEGKQP